MKKAIKTILGLALGVSTIAVTPLVSSGCTIIINDGGYTPIPNAFAALEAGNDSKETELPFVPADEQNDTTIYSCPNGRGECYTTLSLFYFDNSCERHQIEHDKVTITTNVDESKYDINWIETTCFDFGIVDALKISCNYDLQTIKFNIRVQYENLTKDFDLYVFSDHSQPNTFLMKYATVDLDDKSGQFVKPSEMPGYDFYRTVSFNDIYYYTTFMFTYIDESGKEISLDELNTTITIDYPLMLKSSWFECKYDFPPITLDFWAFKVQSIIPISSPLTISFDISYTPAGTETPITNSDYHLTIN